MNVPVCPFKLFIVVPCFNEAEVLDGCAAVLRGVLARLEAGGVVSGESRVLFVDDGSRDGTWERVLALHEADPAFCGISLSRNFGQQAALLAGLSEAYTAGADAAVTIDADLQDDPSAIEEMARIYAEGGGEIVRGVRSSRAADGFFKRTSANAFYAMMRLLGTGVVPGHADFRLMGRRALESVMQYRESDLFLRGVVTLIGYKTADFFYERRARTQGITKYSLHRMCRLALDGVCSFSVAPLRLIAFTGFAIFLVSIVMLLWSLARKLTGHTVQGWTSLMLSIWMLGGVQLLSLGIVGEYVGRTFREAKGRPRWIIEERLGCDLETR